MSESSLNTNNVLPQQNSEPKEDIDDEPFPNTVVTMPLLEIMMAENYMGSIEMDDDQMDIMTASYSEIFNDDTKNSETTTLNLKNYEETGVTVGYNDEADLSTPVYEGIDPTQALLYEDRVSSFLNRGFESSCQETSEEKSKENPNEKQLERANGVNSSRLGDYCESPNQYAGAELFPISLYLRPLKQPVPPIDPSVIFDLEAHARGMATSVDTLIENLTGTLHSISSLTVECVETYRDGVCKTCDAVDSNIKSMYQLMAKCEELSKSMAPIYQMSEQIKEIRRLLDLFESVVPSGGA